MHLIKNKDYKYIRAIGAFYFRLTAPAADVYKILEELYTDYRRLIFRDQSGKF